MTLALLGLLAYRTVKGKGRLADMIGTGLGQRGAGNPAPPGETNGPGGAAAGGGPGGLLGGAMGGGILSGGLKDLLDRFRQSGLDNKAQSWVSTGANHPIAPNELEQVLGEERLSWLMEQTGLPREQLLAGLSSELPNAIDQLTPNGRTPTEDEFAEQLKRG